ncbi:DUF1737 domain-containing protein [Salmonella enterica]|nr:DUF1737 domain-containing protein [Salmonella enterica]EHF1242926.1 DUF1737 domain-containing protein [Salmonella enterica]EJS6906032.1 DUF1737 domain-containing protein [Salmonella enterica]EJS6906786.1 DUF1737 domain-containing protein [Salmonella enterica]
MSEKTLNGLPRYRLLTGPDDASFCQRVSEMLDKGYELLLYFKFSYVLNKC